MKCQNLFSGENKKNILSFRLLKILLRVLNIKLEILYLLLVNGRRPWILNVILSCIDNLSVTSVLERFSIGLKS